MACEANESRASAKVSKPASEATPAQKNKEQGDVKTVPNQFPLKDGKLPKPKKKNKNKNE